ncbi:MAG TPA: LptA/OstA family protein [Candidatus Acidoferrum sp.]|nr:LptA/OstA family protein [Candidatus Acidoferrum sp.]
MKRSESAKYARWSATVALLLAFLTTGVYLERKWVAHREKEKAPPPAPKDVTRLSSGLTFSKMDGSQKIFTVEASKATDFKAGDASLLEDVKITIFGKTGQRHDLIHTRSCQYEKVGGSIVCSGEVQLDLESAADAGREARNPAPSASQKVHVETRGVTFNHATGTALTDQPVRFIFPGGNGQAMGVEYHAEEGELRLLKNVQLLLAPLANSGANDKSAEVHEPVKIAGKSLEFGRDSRIMRLNGPVKAETGTAQLVAGELTLMLDSGFRAQKLVAAAGSIEKKPELASQGKDGSANLIAESLTADFAPEGWLTRIEGLGSVRGSRHSGKGEEEFTANRATLGVQPKVNQPKDLRLEGHVLLSSHAILASEEESLRTEALHMEFAPGKKDEGGKPSRAETLAPGSMEWTDAAPRSGGTSAPGNGSATKTRLQADKLELTFDGDGQAKQLVATGNVLTERSSSGRPLQTATAQNGVAQLLPAGGWAQMDFEGEVKLKEGERSAQAGHALFLRSAQTAVLTGKALVRDATTETQAPRITFAQTTGDIRAEGGVRSTDFAAKGRVTQLAPAPAILSSDTLEASSKTARALYSGHARFWQGESVMEADSIELQRNTRILIATGNVRAVFPQTVADTLPPSMAAQAPPRKAKLWHVSADTLTYLDAEGRVHLEKNVVAQSAEQRMRGAAVDMYFTRSGTTGANQKNASSPPSAASGAQQISRAVGTGGVTVDQGRRRATAERGEYIAKDGKFVMSGGTPTIYDSSQGTTTGRQLTFFLADDTIIVDSENGSRTLTKHRVEK